MPFARHWVPCHISIVGTMIQLPSVITGAPRLQAMITADVVTVMNHDVQREVSDVTGHTLLD